MSFLDPSFLYLYPKPIMPGGILNFTSPCSTTYCTKQVRTPVVQVNSLWQPIGKAHVLQYKRSNQASQAMNNQNKSESTVLCKKHQNTTCGLRGKTKRSSDTNRYSQDLMMVIPIITLISKSAIEHAAVPKTKRNNSCSNFVRHFKFENSEFTSNQVKRADRNHPNH